jgi:hypothetical protein
MTPIEIMLLIVMLIIMPVHTGRNPKISDVVNEKNQSSPPTMTPIGTALDTQAIANDVSAVIAPHTLQSD